MAKYFEKEFALNGTKNAVPDDPPGGGFMSYDEGWGGDYTLEYADPNAKDIDRGQHNQLWNDITGAVKEIQDQGFPSWTIDATPYADNSAVRHNGENWISNTASNNEEPGTGTQWGSIGPSTITIVERFEADGTFTVPDDVTQVIATVIASGGDGGGINSGNEGAAGGGGSGYGCVGLVNNLTPGANISITVGSVAGATSSFGSDITCTGGETAPTPVSAVDFSRGGRSGSLTVSANVDVLHRGGNTGEPAASTAPRVAGGSTSYSPGTGGSSLFGVGGRSVGDTGTGKDGFVGDGFGSGGSGAGSYMAAPINYVGGPFRPGIVVVQYMKG